MEISRELFDQERRPQFGRSNPERMQRAFWEWMIRGPDSLPTREQEGVHAELGFVVREGILKSVYGPWRVRDLFQIPLNCDEGPIWTFDRMGRTCTKLTDGRMVCIGGEHEDYYDPDFCIYNDVVVFGPDDQIEVYGYPKDVFPPTDFHTATLVGNRLIVVGCLGYPDHRRPGHTPVYALDLSDYCISEVRTTGEVPGWVFKHEAELDPDGGVTIRNGEIIEEIGGEHRYWENFEDYRLDIATSTWQRVTSRNWRQFSIHQEDRRWFAERPTPETLLPRRLKHTVMPCEDWNGALIDVEGVPISLQANISDIRVIVRGDLGSRLSSAIVDEIRANAEASLGRPCALEVR